MTTKPLPPEIMFVPPLPSDPQSGISFVLPKNKCVTGFRNFLRLQFETHSTGTNKPLLNLFNCGVAYFGDTHDLNINAVELRVLLKFFNHVIAFETDDGALPVFEEFTVKSSSLTFHISPAWVKNTYENTPGIYYSVLYYLMFRVEGAYRSGTPPKTLLNTLPEVKTYCEQHNTLDLYACYIPSTKRSLLASFFVLSCDIPVLPTFYVSHAIPYDAYKKLNLAVNTIYGLSLQEALGTQSTAALAYLAPKNDTKTLEEVNKAWLLFFEKAKPNFQTQANVHIQNAIAHPLYADAALHPFKHTNKFSPLVNTKKKANNTQYDPFVLVLFGKAGVGKDTVAAWVAKETGGVCVAHADEIKRMAYSIFQFTEEQLWGPSEARNAPDTRYDKFGSSAWEMAFQRLHAHGRQACSWAFQCGDSKEREDAYRRLLVWFRNLSEYDHLSPRIVLQTLGTEWGRAIKSDVWVRRTLDIAEQLQKNPKLSYSRKSGLHMIPTPKVTPMVIVTDGRFQNELEYHRDAEGHTVLITRPTEDQTVGIEAHASEHLDLDLSMIHTVIDNDGTLEDLKLKVAEALPQYQKKK